VQNELERENFLAGDIVHRQRYRERAGRRELGRRWRRKDDRRADQISADGSVAVEKVVK